MPDTRSHRGPHPKDAQLFAEGQRPKLRNAVADYSWLLSRGYGEKSALKLVGNRYRLRRRQRTAVLRSACSDEARAYRKRHECPASACHGKHVALDGYNVLITIESALAGAFILVGRDGCYRDLASMHGTYKRVDETRPAIRLIGQALDELDAEAVQWYLDRPVNNSGRLKTMITEEAERHGWPWRVGLVDDPDEVLAEREALIVSSDSGILDETERWVNLAPWIIQHRIPEAKLCRLDPDGPGAGRR